MNALEMPANDNLGLVLADIEDMVSRMAKDDRVPAAYFVRLGELTDELRDRLRAAGRIA